jgi:hypothetical protein
MSNEWILEYRTDYLTAIFKYFPLLASESFYMGVIALGYWRKPSSRLFKSLAFLVPFSTLLNCLFKNLFQIEPPDLALHLIPVHDPFGFPSGDVQVALTFWGYLFISLSPDYRLSRYLCFIPILGIAMSRIYLGVHSFYDVLAALMIGAVILYVWNRSVEVTHKKYWLLLALTTTLYATISIGLKWPPMVFMSLGALIGFGVSFKWILNIDFGNKIDRLSAALCLFMVILLSTIFPILKTNDWTVYCSLVLKFLVITVSIYYLIPTLYLKMKKLNI